jgi:uncharacterized protein (DUF2062 family)
MSNVVVELSGDEAKLIASYRRAVEAANKLPPEIDKAAKASAAAEKELKKFADGVKEIQVTPLQRYRQEVEKLEQAQAKGLLTQQQASTHQAKLRAEMDGTKVASTSLTETLASGAASIVLPYLGLQTVLGQINAAFAEMEQKAQAAIASSEKLVAANTAFAQISGSRAELLQYQERADELASTTGLSRDRSAQLLFTMASSGLGDRQDLAQKLAVGDTLSGKTESLTSLATTLPKLTGGKLTPEQAVNVGFAAAREARVSVESIQPELMRAYEQASRTGASPDEIAAAVAQGSYRFLAPGARQGAFSARVATNDELRQLKQSEVVARFMEDDELRQEVLGDSMEANAWFEFLKTTDLTGAQNEVRSAIADTGGANDLWTKKNRIGLTPLAEKRIGRMASENAQEISVERRADDEEEIRRGRANLETMLEDSEAGFAPRQLARYAYWRETRLMGQGGGDAARSVATDMLGRAGEILLDAAEKQQNAAAQMVRGTANGAAQQRAQANAPRE